MNGFGMKFTTIENKVISNGNPCQQQSRFIGNNDFLVWGIQICITIHIFQTRKEFLVNKQKSTYFTKCFYVENW